MNLTKIAVGDFETDGIQKRPTYPPRPVGLALDVPGVKPRYYAWGHPTKNNATKEQAISHVKMLMSDGWIFCWHNAGFDLEVMEEHFGIKWPAEHHDTLILAFQDDPRQKSFSLKPLAEKELGEPPTERDELKEWILKHVPEARRKKKEWAAYIALAPGDLVGKYAIGDVTRTRKLLRLYIKRILSDPLQRQAYERERRLTRVITRMEARGIPADAQALEKDIPKYKKDKRKLEVQLWDRLRVAKKYRDHDEFKWAGEGFADVLERAKVVKEWIVTGAGGRSTSVDSLREVGVDEKLVHELEVRSQLQTCIGTFMENWYEQAREFGRFFPRINQVRQDYHGGGGGQEGRLVGTETGRLSMSYIQNAPRGDKDDRVPKVRRYIIPGVVLNGRKYKRGLLAINKRDYSQQELRILAHEENGPFLAKYLANPKIDAHIAVMELIQELTGILINRRQTKDLNFGLIYGMGIAKLALKLGLPLAEAKILFKAHIKSLPGVEALKKELKACAEEKRPIYTWGGRKYFCEQGKMVNGRFMDFWYKMLNLKVQGGAADATKQAMLNYFTMGYDDEFPLMLQVHDELLTISPWTRRKRAHEILNKAMLDLDFKLPMLSEGSSSVKSWGEMEKVPW